MRLLVSSTPKRVATVITLAMCLWAGVSQAQEGLGWEAYQRGDYATAFLEFKELAGQGNPLAQNLLGEMYRDGLGVPKNYEEALKWFRESAERGWPLAHLNVGIMHAEGMGVPQDYAAAERFWRRAADSGLAEAQYSLGVLYSEGLGVIQNSAEAVRWWRFAAQDGHADAQYNLGVSYDQGLGVALSKARAVEWYRKSAEQGHSDAQFNLGAMYELGEGVSKSYSEAAKWYRMAARQGNASAQTNLGSLFARGEGVAKAYVQAFKWFWLAADEEEVAADNLAILSELMTSDEIDEALRLAEGWKAGALVEERSLELAVAQALVERCAPGKAASPEEVPLISGFLVQEPELSMAYEAFAQGQVEKAFREYAAAAEAEHHGAENNLGVLYETGLGVSLNDVEAAKWYLRSAEGGNPMGQYNLGTLLVADLVSGDCRIDNGDLAYSLAYKWFSCASNDGYGNVDAAAKAASQVLEELMTVDQISEAEQLASAC